jgi:hypothetical protein
VGRKRDLKQVDAVCREFRMGRAQELAFREYIHECKDSGHRGSAGGGDFTMDELRQLAREFLNLDDPA